MSNIEQETRDLISELRKVQTTLKPGSVEREQREDAVYQRLYNIADIIQKDHAHDPRMQDIYYTITEERLVDHASPPSSVDKFPVYGDAYRMFTKYPITPRVNLYLEQMAIGLNAMAPNDVQRHFEDVQQDGAKEIMKSLVPKCQREKWMNKSSRKCCSHCWNETMRQIFFMGSEMLTVEIKKRIVQVNQLTQDGHLTTHDALYLSKYINNVMNKLEHLVSSSKKPKKRKKEWVKLVESIYILMVSMINEIMMKLVKMFKLKATIRNDQVINDMLT